MACHSWVGAPVSRSATGPPGCRVEHIDEDLSQVLRELEARRPPDAPPVRRRVAGRCPGWAPKIGQQSSGFSASLRPWPHSLASMAACTGLCHAGPVAARVLTAQQDQPTYASCMLHPCFMLHPSFMLHPCARRSSRCRAAWRTSMGAAATKSRQVRASGQQSDAGLLISKAACCRGAAHEGPMQTPATLQPALLPRGTHPLALQATRWPRSSTAIRCSITQGSTRPALARSGTTTTMMLTSCSTGQRSSAETAWRFSSSCGTGTAAARLCKFGAAWQPFGLANL